MASKSDGLLAWLDYLGIGTAGPTKIDGHFTSKINGVANYDFIKGWGTSETPLLIANSSDQHVRVPGNMKPHSVAVHPSPTLQAVVGWRSPVAATYASASASNTRPSRMRQRHYLVAGTSPRAPRGNGLLPALHRVASPSRSGHSIISPSNRVIWFRC